MPSAPPDPHTEGNKIIKGMLNGRVIPFLGAGVNLTNRPAGVRYKPNGPYLPNASELSEGLQKEFGFNLPNICNLPDPTPAGVRCKWRENSLLRVSWYISIKEQGDLYHHLQRVFEKPRPLAEPRPPTDVHKFFASFRQRLVKKGYQVPPQLIVTTNYDELLEQAFDDVDEPYDVFSYFTDGDSVFGKFTHKAHGSRSEPVVIGPDYNPKPEIQNTIILKIHGTVHPKDYHKSTFVITEDDYIDYAANLGNVPVMLTERMLHHRFLYLGYSLSDWNFRVFLRGIKARGRFRDDGSWAIMKELDDWDRLYWEQHNFEIFEMPLDRYIAILNGIVGGLATLR